MEQLQGTHLSSFPFTDLNKVYDLIEFDGPLLSHYQDSFNKDFLFYWIDNDSTLNRWMFIEVSDEDLTDYLFSRISLRSVILANANVIITHIDRSLNYTDVIYLKTNNIPSDYLPDEDSFFEFELPTIYKDKYLSKNYYLNILREGANVYRLLPKDHIFNHAVKASDAGKFLTNLTSSASAYTTFEFYNNFKDQILNPDKLKVTLQSVKKSTEILLIGTHFRSFEVTVSIDTVMGMEDGIKGFKEWKKSVLNNYYEDVINIDYTNQDTINKLIVKFPDDTLRKKIIKPIADILLDSSVMLETKSSVNSTPVLHKSINRKTYKKLVSPSLNPESPEQIERKKMISMIVEVIEKDGKTIFNKKIFDEGIIAQTEVGQVTLSLNYLNYDQYEISFRKPIEYQYFIDEQNLNRISCKPFNISVSGKNTKEVTNNFIQLLGGFFISSIDSGLNKDLLDEYIEDITET